MDKQLLKYAKSHKTKLGVNWSEWKGQYSNRFCIKRLNLLLNRKPKEMTYWTDENVEKLKEYAKNNTFLRNCKTCVYWSGI